MKKLNEFGLPADDGYDYNQHIVQDEAGGELVYSTFVKPKQTEPDIDYKPENMGQEQKEVFEALQFEGDDDAFG